MSNNVLTIDLGDDSNTLKKQQDLDLIDETLALIGPAYKGPAFVPITVREYDQSPANNTINTFKNIFGSEDKNYFSAPSIAST